MTTKFSVVREFDAPRELVFECLTTAEQLTHFWGPTGTTTPADHITIELRVGGLFETIMIDDATGARYATRRGSGQDGRARSTLCSLIDLSGHCAAFQAVSLPTRRSSRGGSLGRRQSFGRSECGRPSESARWRPADPAH
jgi:Activator of Hsp90 ATPase homolog 1-like protein